jgi:hypothetical protein
MGWMMQADQSVKRALVVTSGESGIQSFINVNGKPRPATGRLNSAGRGNGTQAS